MISVPDPFFWIPDPNQDPALFVSGFKDAKKSFFFISLNIYLLLTVQ
jgi:hypothetical protein